MINFVLTLLFGWAGYYRLYKGQIFMALLYLCTGGLLLCGWIYDIALCCNESGLDVKFFNYLSENIEKAASSIDKMASNNEKRDNLEKARLAKQEKKEMMEKVDQYIKTPEYHTLLEADYPTIENYMDSLDDSYYIVNYNGRRLDKIISYVRNKTNNFYSDYNSSSLTNNDKIAIEALIDCIIEQNNYNVKSKYDQLLTLQLIYNGIYWYCHIRAEKKLNIKDANNWLEEYVSNDLIEHESENYLTMLMDYLRMAKDVSCEKDYETIKIMVNNALNKRKKEVIKNQLLHKTTKIEHRYTMTEIDQMSGEEFEQFVGKLFSKFGYKIIVTQISGDQGVDVIIQKEGLKTGIQCKCYSNKVSNSAVQEVVAGKSLYQLDKVMIVTTNYFTRSAIQLANSNNVMLWDRDKLISMLELVADL